MSKTRLWVSTAIFWLFGLGCIAAGLQMKAEVARAAAVEATAGEVPAPGDPSSSPAEKGNAPGSPMGAFGVGGFFVLLGLLGVASGVKRMGED